MDSKVSKPEIIILAGLESMPSNGAFRVLRNLYDMAERTGRERCLKEMEEATHNNVDPIRYEAAQFVTVYIAIIYGLSSGLTAIISLIPLVLASIGWMPIWNAYISSLAQSLNILFPLGMYLGKVARENGWLYDIAMLTAGAFAPLMIFLIQLLSNT